MNKKWMAPKLKHRITFMKATNETNSSGGFDLAYEDIATVWAGIKELNEWGQFIRGVQVELSRGVQDEIATETHEFVVRYSAVKSLGKNFASAFNYEFDSIADLNPVKSDWFIKMNEGTYPTKGRIFRITRCKRDDNYKTNIRIRTYEIEERGTGWPV